MNKKPVGLFITILLLAVLSLFVILPASIPVSFTLPKLPFTKKPIHITKIPLSPDFTIGQTHISFSSPVKKGLDLEGGTSVTLRADMKGVQKSQRDDALSSARSVIERRINYFGVSEPVVQTAKVGGDYRIIAEIPGVTDVNQAIALIGKTAKLSFWEEGASGSAKLAAGTTIPYGLDQLFGTNAKPTNLTGGDLSQAVVSFNQNTGEPQVELHFTSNGAKKFADITQRNVGKIVAIVLDNFVLTAPRVQQVITGGTAQITGNFTSDQAKALQIQLNGGALPVSLSVLEQHAVGATLGKVSLQKSMFAGALGFIVIVVFMVVMYRRLGVIASMALAIYTLLTIAFFKTGFFFFPPITLTLAGIAGFILSIGIAVDANILIFERMKEEERTGKSHLAALDLGFTRAWPSIRDSNIASIITSIVLLVFGSSIVKGFALTLLVGVLISMFSAIVVTRTFLKMFYRT
jgi:preprotein translocase subunit SecD